MSKFWIYYILFFIFVFPMIFEYLPRAFMSDQPEWMLTSPWMAMTYLVIGGAAWVAFITWAYRRFIRPIGSGTQVLTDIMENGRPVTVHVERKRVKQERSEFQQLDLEISLVNLSGTMVKIPYEINDTKPEKKRYEVGEFIKMRMDPQLREPYLVAEGTMIKKDTGTVRSRYLSFAALVSFSVLYLIFSYWLQNNGYGWRFLHFWHPWVTIPFWGLLIGWLMLDLFIGKLMGGMMEGSPEDMQLIFKGKAASARVIAAQQTGTYINEQPQIRFDLEFEDDKGVLRGASFKKIVSLLHVHTAEQSYRKILYSPEDPSKVIFAEDFLVES